jgi:hypothetical protein
MHLKISRLGVVVAMAMIVAPLSAQESGQEESSMESTTMESTSMSRSEGSAKVLQLRFVPHTVSFDVPKLETYTRDVPVRGYRGVDDFFSVREANSNIKSGQWEFELEAGWSTFRSGDGRDDDFMLRPSLKYAFTDTNFIEVGLLPINLGDGSDVRDSDFVDIDGFSDDSHVDDGAGDVLLRYFWQMAPEQDIWPAAAMWFDTRIPTGEGSEKFDFTWNMSLTKTLYDGFRAHLAGFLMSANGARGDLNDRDYFGDRRDFQWGIGAGVDFAVTESDLMVLNYMNRSSHYDGNGTNHIYEAGWVHNLDDCNRLMLAATYDDNEDAEEGPRWSGRFQWAVSF